MTLHVVKKKIFGIDIINKERIYFKSLAELKRLLIPNDTFKNVTIVYEMADDFSDVDFIFLTENFYYKFESEPFPGAKYSPHCCSRFLIEIFDYLSKMTIDNLFIITKDDENPDPHILRGYIFSHLKFEEHIPNIYFKSKKDPRTYNILVILPCNLIPNFYIHHKTYDGFTRTSGSAHQRCDSIWILWNIDVYVPPGFTYVNYSKYDKIFERIDELNTLKPDMYQERIDKLIEVLNKHGIDYKY